MFRYAIRFFEETFFCGIGAKKLFLFYTRLFCLKNSHFETHIFLSKFLWEKVYINNLSFRQRTRCIWKITIFEPSCKDCLSLVQIQFLSGIRIIGVLVTKSDWCLNESPNAILSKWASLPLWHFSHYETFFAHEKRLLTVDFAVYYEKLFENNNVKWTTNVFWGAVKQIENFWIPIDLQKLSCAQLNFSHPDAPGNEAKKEIDVNCVDTDSVAKHMKCT